jgi:hypothetical protein
MSAGLQSKQAIGATFSLRARCPIFRSRAEWHFSIFFHQSNSIVPILDVNLTCDGICVSLILLLIDEVKFCCEQNKTMLCSAILCFSVLNRGIEYD